MAELAADNSEIAAAFGISEATLGEWKRKCNTFAREIEEGIAAVNRSLEAAILQRVVGYEYYAEKVVCDDEGTIKRRRLLVKLPPDAKAIEIWLAAHPDYMEAKT
jgi:hypothetical protein